MRTRLGGIHWVTWSGLGGTVTWRLDHAIDFFDGVESGDLGEVVQVAWIVLFQGLLRGGAEGWTVGRNTRLTA